MRTRITGNFSRRAFDVCVAEGSWASPGVRVGGFSFMLHSIVQRTIARAQDNHFDGETGKTSNVQPPTLNVQSRTLDVERWTLDVSHLHRVPMSPILEVGLLMNGPRSAHSLSARTKATQRADEPSAPQVP